MANIKRLLVIFDRKQKIQFILLFIMVLIGAAFETVGVSALMPMIAAITTPDKVNEGYTGLFYHMFGSPDINTFIVYMCILLVGFYLVKAAYLAIMYYVQFRFIYGGQREMSKKIYELYITMPYEYYVSTNFAVITRKVNQNVTQAYSYLINLMQLMTQSVTAVFIVGYLFTVDQTMTIVLAVAVMIFLFIVRSFVTPLTKKAGVYSRRSNTRMTKWMRQSVDGIKEIKVGRHERFFKYTYSEAVKEFTDNARSSALWGKIPSVLIETIAISGLMLYFFFLIKTGRSIMDMLSILGVFAMGIVKLMPCASTVSGCISGMGFFAPGVEELEKSISGDLGVASMLEGFAHDGTSIKRFCSELRLNNIRFAYQSRKENIILDGAQMVIPYNKSVGIKGPSGAGKSTTLDILLGVLKPLEGTVTVDGINIEECYSGYLSFIGYIPQMVFMMDDTVKRNVALGIDDRDIDDERVWKVLEEAQLADFVRTLPEGLDTVVGDRALKLSGGQRQRLGIARALYNDPSILVFDEATSSLDNETEEAVMEAINSMKGKHTMIIVAHRLNTIANCDIIYNVE
ncbi:MAG: ABC transporter ATP-binding protein, partial [Eubacterium sp.]|nr:ABC transporter ATP-binding protein [Eubacterium sp.]